MQISHIMHHGPSHRSLVNVAHVKWAAACSLATRGAGGYRLVRISRYFAARHDLRGAGPASACDWQPESFARHARSFLEALGNSGAGVTAHPASAGLGEVSATSTASKPAFTTASISPGRRQSPTRCSNRRTAASSLIFAGGESDDHDPMSIRLALDGSSALHCETPSWRKNPCRTRCHAPIGLQGAGYGHQPSGVSRRSLNRRGPSHDLTSSSLQTITRSSAWVPKPSQGICVASAPSMPISASLRSPSTPSTYKGSRTARCRRGGPTLRSSFPSGRRCPIVGLEGSR